MPSVPIFKKAAYIQRRPPTRGLPPDTTRDPRRNDPTCPGRIMALIDDDNDEKAPIDTAQEYW